jgi:hypothetical protein
MMNLTEAVAHIDANYKQEFPVNEVSSTFIPDYGFGPLPKFLYRGEAQIYNETKSTASRIRLLTEPDFNEINIWLSGRHYPTGVLLKDNSLYHFIRESIFGVSVVDAETDDPNIDRMIAGLLQHYGFDTAWVDFTSEILVAAFFASSQSAPGSEGRLFILPTSGIEEYVFDLRSDKPRRPKRQSAFALVLPYSYDLKMDNVVSPKNGISIPFCLTQEDITRFDRKDLLSVVNDATVTDLRAWFECHIAHNPEVSESVRQYFKKKIDAFQ